MPPRSSKPPAKAPAQKATKKAPAKKKPVRRYRKQEEVDAKLAHFLARFAEHGNKSQACREADLPRQTVDLRARSDEALAEQLDAAKQQAADRLEEEARRRAVDGWMEPVFYKGEEVGYVRKFSDTLLLRLLEAHSPARFSRRYQALGRDGQPADPAQGGVYLLPDTVPRDAWAVYAEQQRDVQNAHVDEQLDHQRSKHGERPR